MRKRSAAYGTKERVNLWVILAGFLVFVLGGLTFYACHFDALWTGMEDLRAVLHEVGGFLIATATLTILWEVIGKRAFLDEVLEKAGIAKELSFAGIHQIAQSFYDPKVDWDFFFRHSRYVDIYFAYAQTWRRVHGDRVREFAQRRGNKVRVVMPDPDHAATITELARRFEYTTADLIKLIRDSETFFLSLRTGSGDNVEIRFVRRCPLFSFYIFDEAAILAFYSHRGRVPIPTFVVAHGSLYKFVRDEFDALMGSPLPAALAAPPPAVPAPTAANAPAAPPVMPASTQGTP